MKQEELEDFGPKLQPPEISLFELRLGFSLPEDYRLFLQQTNGALVPEDAGYFYIEDANWWIQINFFFGLRRPDAEVLALDSVLGRLREQHPERFHESLGRLPVASDHFGNKAYLILAGPERGCVYFWMHDTDAPDDKLSSSFGSFIESLRKRPPEIQAKLQELNL